MNIARATQSLLISLSLLYVAVSGLGVSIMGAIPMTVASTCSMLGHEIRMCPMSAADHLNTWEGMFKAIPERQQKLPIFFFTILGVASSILWRNYTLRMQGNAREGSPPGCIPLFVQMVIMGMHQRLTYG